MTFNEASQIFKKEISKKVVAYEDRGSYFIFITALSKNKYDDRFYKVSKSGVTLTNPILCRLNKERLIEV